MAFRSLALGSVTLLTLLSSMPMAGAGSNFSVPSYGPSSYLNYTAVTGFFKQDDPATVPSTFNYTSENFGLIDRTYTTDAAFDPHQRKTQWQRFGHYVRELNRHAGKDVKYRVLYMGRHGEGYRMCFSRLNTIHHPWKANELLDNVAETFYGTPAWNCYWSEQPGNATANWTDARLTTNGISQAQIAHDFWTHEIKEQKIPVPQSGLPLPRDHPFAPTVKELLREGIGLHTCDKRSSRTFIHNSYPSYRIEKGFTEDDELWSPTLRESSSAQAARLRRLLDDVFTHDESTYISFTSHSGSIASILSVIGHRTFSLNTGAVIPVLLKVERIHKAAPSVSIAPSTGAPPCTANPSASAQVTRSSM